MSRLSQTQKIVELLKANPNQRFNARKIAEQIVDSYPEDYRDKRQNPRFVDDKAFISQVVAEIGSQKDQIVKNDAHVFWQDKPRPRVYWYNPEKLLVELNLKQKNLKKRALRFQQYLKQQLFLSTIYTQSLSIT